VESLALPAARFRLRFETSCHPATVCAAGASSLAAAVFAWFAVLRYETFNATGYDLGFFDQVVWEISRGRPGITSYTFYYDFFGQHVEPILFLYGALYRIWADPRLLLVSQALAVGAAAWLLHRCAMIVLAPRSAAVLSASFLLAVPLHTALAFDFHPEVSSCLLVFGGLYLALRGRSWNAFACWATLPLFKEDEALLLPGLGLLLFLLTQRPRPAAVLAVAGPLWALLALGIIEPHWRHGYAGDLTQDYAAFGTTLTAALACSVQHPLKVAHLALGHGGLAALLRWNAGTGLAGVLAPLGLLAAAPQLLLQLASRHSTQHALRLHYGVEGVPIVFAFLLAELRWLSRQPRLRDGLALVVGGLAIGAFAISSPFRSGFPYPIPAPAHLAAIRAGDALIPPSGTLRADSTLAAHLSQREHIQEFPGSDWGEYVAIDWRAFHTQQAEAQGYDVALAALPAQGYTEIFDQDGVQIWHR
jgi:uncharacterized membrane protein